jgi:hypothetical protein
MLVVIIGITDVLHDGEPVSVRGDRNKYMVRTEVMFSRVDTSSLPKVDSYLGDPNYIKALALYRQSHALDIAGDARGFTDSYLKAIELQHQAQLSISSDRHLLVGLSCPLCASVCSALNCCTKELNDFFQIIMIGYSTFAIFRLLTRVYLSCS